MTHLTVTWAPWAASSPSVRTGVHNSLAGVVGDIAGERGNKKKKRGDSRTEDRGSREFSKGAEINLVATSLTKRRSDQSSARGKKLSG